ncbi:hypothetical protein vseg_012937 [Gypsophila vaccaria]
MSKHSPSRGLKSKGVKVKHVLQICVFVAACFWLIHQVKHSGEKSRRFDAKDDNVVNNVQMDSEILRLGRKDLPRIAEIGTGSEELEKDDGEKESEGEETKHEEDEREQEEGRIRETEEERGDGDDETDENELDRKEAEHEHEEEEIDKDDDEKEDIEDDIEENHAENVENELAGNEERVDADEDEDERKEDLPDLEEIQGVDERGNQDHDVENADIHEAREEHYKADDASSEVAHHVHNIILKTENVTSDHASDIFGEVDIGRESEIKSSDDPDALKKADVALREESNEISDGIVIEQNKNKNNLNNFGGGEFQNSMSDILPDNRAKISSDSTSVDEEHENKDAGASQHDPIDTLDTNDAEEEDESRVDLDNLPGIKMAGQTAEEATVE